MEKRRQKIEVKKDGVRVVINAENLEEYLRYDWLTAEGEKKAAEDKMKEAIRAQGTEQ